MPTPNAAWGSASEIADLAGASPSSASASPSTPRRRVAPRPRSRAQAVERALADAGLAPPDVDGLMYTRVRSASSSTPPPSTSTSAPRTTCGSRPRAAACVGRRRRPYARGARDPRAQATTHRQHLRGRWATQRGADDRRPRARCTPRSGSSRTSRCRSAGSRSRSTSPPSPAGTCTSTARRRAARRDRRRLPAPRQPHARGAVMHDKPLSLEQTTSRRPMLVEPFRKEDCCLISDGGGAYVMTTPERARDLRAPVGRGARASAAGNSAHRHALGAAARLHVDAAGVRRAGRVRHGGHRSPPTSTCSRCYDPFTIVSLMQIEDMGFCAKGEGGAFVEGDALALRRRAPAVQHPRRDALARLRARHRPRRRGRAPAARRGRRPGAGRRASASTAATPARSASTLVLRRRMMQRRLPAARPRLGADPRLLGGAPRATSSRSRAATRAGATAGTRARAAALRRRRAHRGRRSSGRGTLFSWVVVHTRWFPQFAASSRS